MSALSRFLSGLARLARSAGLQQLVCISAALPAPGVCSYLNWILPLLHQSQMNLLKKQTLVLMLLRSGLPPRVP